MGLTDAEKVAGRRFRDDANANLLALNEADPPTFVVPHFLGMYRHLCPARHNRSTAIELKERYLTSPIYPGEGVAPGRFGFIYREGWCRGCGQSARSGTGRLVDAQQRPPLTGRVTKELS